MAFELAPLPYPETALEPHMSAKTLSFHHGKHHKAYVETLNKLVKDTPLAAQSLEEIIHATVRDESKPKGGGKPTGDLAKRIESDLGGFDKFLEDFKKAGATQFGSGWAWLVLDHGKLNILKTPDAVNPLSKGLTALLTYDVWEHAYYLDYQNRRPDFIQGFLQHLVNWDFAAENLAKARDQRGAAAD